MVPDGFTTIFHDFRWFPMVSGGLALIKQEFSSLTNAQVVDRLLATALDIDEYPESSIYGHGMKDNKIISILINKIKNHKHIQIQNRKVVCPQLVRT